MNTSNDIERKKDEVILHASRALELLNIPIEERTLKEENELLSNLFALEDALRDLLGVSENN